MGVFFGFLQIPHSSCRALRSEPTLPPLCRRLSGMSMENPFKKWHILTPRDGIFVQVPTLSKPASLTPIYRAVSLP